MVQLSTKEISALHEALDDEYKAWATYDQVIDDFGPIRPFINIRDAESRHIDALLQVFNDYDLTAPSNNWVGRVPRYEDVQAACAARDRGCFCELNAHPDRLDLRDEACKAAKDLGLKLAISTDASSTFGLDYMRFGIDQARRGWLEKSDVINTRPLEELRKQFKR